MNLIPMAGRGNRFFQDKYRIPKPFVPILGKPMFIRALESFPASDKNVFLVLQEHLQRYHIARMVQSHAPQGEIVSVNEVTEGQACTCMLARDHFVAKEPLFIASCDYQTLYDERRYEALAADPEIDVIIWTFKIGSIKKSDPNAFAYCVIDEGDGRVTKVVEKETISDQPENDPAVVGSFYFRDSSLFTRAVEKMIAKDIRVNNEFYVATAINQLIEEGLRVIPFEVNQFISFGNPFELMNFEYWEDYFEGLEDHPYNMQADHGRMRR